MRCKNISCVWLFLIAYASITLVNVFCEDFNAEETLNVKPQTGTSTEPVDENSAESLHKMTEKAAKQDFSADVSRTMKLIINSLYKNKEIFLRELISNAADAVDKMRFLSITDKSALSETEDLLINIKVNEKEKTLSIRDTGIGMTKEDLVKNLGTIARSGTFEFMSKMEANNGSSSDLIGQFGVGFYSAFLVADRVTVVSKNNDDDQYIWESDSSSFKVTKDPRGNTIGRGTEIILHLKDEAKEYLNNRKLKEVVRKYSQFVTIPIRLWDSHTEQVPVEEEQEEEKPESTESSESADEVKVEEEKPKDEKPKTVEKTIWDWVRLNDQKPIWTRKASEVSAEEYNEFFKVFSSGSEEPLAKIHFSAEGEVSFSALLFIGKTLRRDFLEKERITDNIKLYVRRVFITENVDEMLPRYLSFVYGIVDSDNLPLNVSRETLQQSKLLKLIKKKLVRKVLEMLKKMSKEDYEKFWAEFAIAIKMGILTDQPNKSRLTDLIRFKTSRSDTDWYSFEDYISRMKDKQEHIYYVASQSLKEAKESPFVERARNKGYEIIYFTEPIDEYMLQSLTEVKGKKVQNLAKDGLDLKLNKDAQDRFEDQKKTFKPLTDWLKDKGLKDLIKEAKISQRLESSPCALIADEYSPSGNMQKVMMAQAYSSSSNPQQQFYLDQKQTLEINPRHPLIKEMNDRVTLDAEDEVAKENALLLFDIASLRSGFIMKDLTGFADRIDRVMRKNMDVSLEQKTDPDEDGLAADDPASEEPASADSSSDSTEPETSSEEVKEEL